MSVKSFSSSRRRYLAAGLVGAASAPFVRYAKALTPRDALQVGLADCPCVRSPWAFYPLGIYGAGGFNPRADYGNEALPSFIQREAAFSQWTEAPEWWSGNAINRALEVPWQADEVGFDALMLPRQGSYLLGVEIDRYVQPSKSEAIVVIGSAHIGATGQILNELELKINVFGRPKVVLADDDGVSVSLALPQAVADTNGGNVILFVYVDHRSGGAQLLSLFQYIPGTKINVSRTLDISHLNSIGGGPIRPRKKVFVGARRDAWGNVYKYFGGRLRRLNIIHFGDEPPNNLTQILDGFSLSRMLPGLFLEGI